MSKPRYKAGPKSSKPADYSSGDTSDESSNKENTHTPSRNNHQSTTFRTPVLDDGITDYNLDYSTDHMHVSSERSPAMHRQIDEQRRVTRSSAFRISGHSRGLPNDSANNGVSQLQIQQKSKSRGRRVKQRLPLNRNERMLREIRKLCNRTTPLIPRLPFSRVVREILLERSTEITRMTRQALEAIQEATEIYMTQRLEDAYLLTLHRGLVTLQLKDLQMMNFILDRC